MRISAHECANHWVSAYGPRDKVTEWVAIAMAESDLQTDVVSPDGAIGLWQIMPFNAYIAGGTVADLYDPEYNARVAVTMSNGGRNCAAWDSCFASLVNFVRPPYLGWPQQYSPAYLHLDLAAAALGTDAGGGASPGSEPTLAAGIDQALADVVLLADHAIPNLTGDLLWAAQVVGRIYQRGWVPWMF